MNLANFWSASPSVDCRRERGVGVMMEASIVAVWGPSYRTAPTHEEGPMRCTRCQGLVIERYGERACCNCGNRPDERLITVKCADVDCRQLPTLHGYCETCWYSRKRSELTQAERGVRYRTRMREKQLARRAKRKGATDAAMVHDSTDELPRAERDYQGGESAPDGLQRPQEAMG